MAGLCWRNGCHWSCTRYRRNRPFGASSKGIPGHGEGNRLSLINKDLFSNLRRWWKIFPRERVTFKCPSACEVYMKGLFGVSRTHAFMIILVAIAALFIASLAVAEQGRIQPPAPPSDRAPAPLPPAPAEQAKCPGPTTFADSESEPYGAGTNQSYIAALGEAISECNLNVASARQEQYDEVMWNKPRCEAVPGCTLKYQYIELSCAHAAGPGSCATPAQDSVDNLYFCSVWGYVNSTFYRCDRGAKYPWEINA